MSEKPIIYKTACYNEPCCSFGEVLERLNEKSEECKRLQNEVFDLQQINDKNSKTIDYLISVNNKLNDKFKHFFNINNTECWDLSMAFGEIKKLQEENKHLIEKLNKKIRTLWEVKGRCKELYELCDEVKDVQDNI